VPGSHLLAPIRRTVEVKLLQAEKRVVFDGSPLEVRF
jgi:hypothetical protein